jgi:hypothetical protein
MTTPHRLLPALLGLALAAGCAPEFTEPSHVTGLRVLALRAEPPELSPPGIGAAPSRAALGALVAHPDFASDGARRVTVLHLTCTPSPDPALPSLCTALTELASPGDLLALVDPVAACEASGLGAPGSVAFAGLEACGRDGCEPVSVRLDPADPASRVTFAAPALELPPALDLAPLPAGDPIRVLGLEAVDLALALDAAPEELAPTAAVAGSCEALAAVAARFGGLWDARANVTALKRIRVRGPDAVNAPNSNPPLSGILLGGALLPAPGSEPAVVAAGAALSLLPAHEGDPGALRETFVELDAAGVPIAERSEEWTYAWFTSSGELAERYTRSAEEAVELEAPASGGAMVWLVLRDQRGGVAFTFGALAVQP